MEQPERAQFLTNPKFFLEQAIREFVRTSPANRLGAFGNAPIFDEPLIGYADGDDPIFTDFQQTVREGHFMPREALATRVSDGGGGASAPILPDISVISFVLPINGATRKSNAKEKQGPSLRWNHTRWQGQEFITLLTQYLVRQVEDQGAWAVAPDLTPAFAIARLPGSLASNWSQRHIAYAAGLGTFSLSDGFITPRGMAMRCGSVVTSLKLTPSPRPYAHHLANCLHYATGKCGVCIGRCPGGAISEKGHDRFKCLDILFNVQKPWIEGAHGPGYLGQYAGCGLCQTGVPCESRIPDPKGRRKQAGASG